MTPTPDPRRWPAHLQPGAVRFGRASHHYEATIAFYRDLVGLPVVGEFTGSFGEDGTIFGLPDTTVQLEIIRDHRQTPGEPGFDQLVLYLDDPRAVAAAVTALQTAGLTQQADQHPYWAANGAVTYTDPDGRDVVFAPWVYGRDPEPVDHDADHGDPSDSLRVERYDGDRDALRHLFAEAEDSVEQLDAYIDDGDVLAAWQGQDLVGHLQLVRVDAATAELKNMAVMPQCRGTGVGRALVEAALAAAAVEGFTRMLVATAAAGVGNLRFYQRCGFRMISVERDAFTPATGYPEPVVIDGVPLRDRVWLDQPIKATPL